MVHVGGGEQPGMTEDMTIMEGGDWASCVYVSGLDWDILSSSTVFSREKTENI